MHMEAVQRYVINLSEEDAKALYKEMGAIVLNKPKLQELYETLDFWFCA